MSIVARFDFPAGRYHATPWGRHVNEGGIEWPPSPWRILRALMACGFNRLGWSGLDDTASRLFDQLAERAPAYLLPETGSAHSRHYMPPFKGNTTRVLDTFATLDRVDGSLIVRWDVALEAEQRGLLHELLEALPYLGRAESWVDATLLDSEPSGTWVKPSETSSPNTERVDLLAPLSSTALQVWRGGYLAGALAQRNEALEAKGKRLTPRDREQIQESVPATVPQVLRAETGELQARGWSLPPGSHWVTYWRPTAALNRVPTPRRVTRRTTTTSVLYALSSKTKSGTTVPRLKDALLRADTIHKALVRGEGPSQFAERDDGHRHPSILCFSMENARSNTPRPAVGAIDHVLVAAHPERPFDEDALRGLRSLRKSYARGVSALWLTPIAEHSGPSEFPLLRRARVWASHTPFVAPRYLKRGGKNTLEGQVRAELEVRGFPSPVQIEFETERGYLPASSFFDTWRVASVENRVALRWRTFRRDRPGVETPASAREQPAIGLRLTFGTEVSGPIALGYGSHFGLGLFQP